MQKSRITDRESDQTTRKDVAAVHTNMPINGVHTLSARNRCLFTAALHQLAPEHAHAEILLSLPKGNGHVTGVDGRAMSP